MTMKSPPHPGLSVLHDCIEPLGLSVTAAAKRLGVSRKQLSQLVNGRAGISPQMALKLDRTFGGGASTWYHMQAAYDLAQAMHEEDDPLESPNYSLAPVLAEDPLDDATYDARSER